MKSRHKHRSNKTQEKLAYQSLEDRKMLAQFVSTGPIVNIGFEDGRPSKSTVSFKRIRMQLWISLSTVQQT
jgi:hypothetical protein